MKYISILYCAFVVYVLVYRVPIYISQIPLYFYLNV